MPEVSTSRVAWAGALALSAVLVGCGSGTKEAAAPPATATPVPSQITQTTQTTPSPSPSLAPKPKPLPRAKDGKNLRACRDARCEVLISDGQTLTLSPEWGLAPFKVTVEDDSVSFYGSALDGTQISMSEQTPDQGGPSKINDVTFRVVAVRGKKAVIKINH
ncbi:hypothetical protein [Nonomuraea typhae]|uniref:DUF3558 domain-containing protein n=1 Tax=Nonomuraea typhae TaxID=2603600 RepID=A0ABW7Z0C6_9ACTN